MSGKKHKEKKKISKNFICYGGYIPELSLVKNGNRRFFRIYEVTLSSFSRRLLLSLLPESGYRMQMIASGCRALLLIGVKAENAEQAVEKLEPFCQYPYLKLLSAREWFRYMAEHLTGEPFWGLPAKKRQRAIDSIQPYDVKIQPKQMEFSGKTVKTVLCIKYPSKLFPAFVTELLALSERITVSVHATKVDPRLCLTGIDLAKDIRAARKESMRHFLLDAEQELRQIYSVSVLITMAGLPGEVERTYDLVAKTCKKYLTGISELNYQQKEAFLSTLPLLDNKIQYNVTMTDDNVLALFPWSELKDRQRSICYGSDIFHKKAVYDRFVDGESGFILSTNYDWSFAQVKKEIEVLCREGCEVHVVGDSDCNFIPDGNEVEREETLKLSDASFRLYQAAVVHWAITTLSVNGITMRKNIEMVKNAASAADSCKKPETYMEAFLDGCTEDAKRTLKIRPMPKTLSAKIKKRGCINEWCVNGGNLEKTLAYALIMERVSGIVYSLKTEYISFREEKLFIPRRDTVYTMTGMDLQKIYQSEQMKKLIADSLFLYVGEHRVSEKLLLSAAVYLTREQRAWISEPARGSVLMAQHMTHLLNKEVS